jgi:hypothetical protein
MAQPQPQASLSQPRGFEPSGAGSSPAAPALALPPPPALAVPVVPPPPTERTRPARQVVVGRDTLVVASEAANSTSRMAPYAVKVVISTSQLMQPALLIITCDEPVVVATISSDPQTHANGRPDRMRYRIGFDSTGFKPGQPLTVLLMAAQPIRVLSVD